MKIYTQHSKTYGTQSISTGKVYSNKHIKEKDLQQCNITTQGTRKTRTNKSKN
jgi:hypothetical protein